MFRDVNIVELRRRYTGETHQQVTDAVGRRRVDGHASLWPLAGSAGQIRLEARIFRELVSADTTFGFGPLMLTGVTPWSDCLTLRVRPDALAAVLGVLLPWEFTDTATKQATDLWGVPGLRARRRADAIELYRPREMGKVMIPIPLGVGSRLLGGLPNPSVVDAVPLWRSSPDQRTPLEHRRERVIANGS